MVDSLARRIMNHFHMPPPHSSSQGSVCGRQHQSLSQKRRVSVLLLVVMLLAIASVYCASVPINSYAWYHVRIVVPDGLHGMITVTYNTAAQKPVSGGWDGSRWLISFVIPEGGRLDTSSVSSLTSPHVLSAEWADGGTLPVEGFDSADEQLIMLRSMGCSYPAPGQYVARFFVGTQTEMKAWGAEEQRKGPEQQSQREPEDRVRRQGGKAGTILDERREP